MSIELPNMQQRRKMFISNNKLIQLQKKKKNENEIHRLQALKNKLCVSLKQLQINLFQF